MVHLTNQTLIPNPAPSTPALLNPTPIPPPTVSSKLSINFIFYTFFMPEPRISTDMNRLQNFFERSDINDQTELKLLSLIRNRDRQLYPANAESFKYYCMHKKCEYMEDLSDLYMMEILTEFCLFGIDHSYWFTYVKNINIIRGKFQDLCQQPTVACMNKTLE